MTGIDNTGLDSVFGRVDQIGIVVRDAEKAAKHYEQFMGTGAFSFMEGEGIAIVGDGGEVTIKGKLGFAQLGGVQIELIQILDGPSIHVDFLEERGEGIHHIGIFTSDIDGDIAKFKEKGINVLQEGIGMMRYAYMDTKPFILELIDRDLGDMLPS
jgi:4-hydroxyphenylpyruvate dioxygenase-like putative hemolysin